MPLELTQLAVEDFSGGITDYILDAQPNQSSELQNLLIDPNKKAITAPGSIIYDPAIYQIPDGTVRVDGVFTALMYPELLVNTGMHIYRPNVTSFQEFLGPTGNTAFSTGDSNSSPAFAEWNFHVYATNSLFPKPIKMFQDGSGTWRTLTAGLPDLASTPILTSAGGTGGDYLYAFHFYTPYTVQTTSFADFGPTTLVKISNVGAPDMNAITITGIPTFTNGTTDNYDTANTRVYIYRTQIDGTVLYQVGDVALGTTSFVDNMSDTTLITKLLLYTNNGVLDYDAPPPCKYVTSVNGVVYYGHVIVGGETLKNRVVQSNQSAPDQAPSGNNIEVLDEITGLSSFNDSPLVFTKNHVYRLNGQYTTTGQGQVAFEDITKTIGCVSHNSIVQTRVGVFWAGNDGFYWTDGFKYQKVSDSINERYKQMVSTETKAGRIYGTYDTKDNRVVWAVGLESGSTDNDSFCTLDLRWGIRDASTFTTRNNSTNFAPTAITFFNKQLIRADRRGYIFKHDAQYLTDPQINTLQTPDLWTQAGIVPLYKSTAFNFGHPQVRKWVPKILLTLQNKSNVSVQIYGVNDNSSELSPLKEIRFRGDTVWGDPRPIWGVTNLLWSFFNLIEEMRRFLATTLRCSFKQIVITQSFTNIYNSDSYAQATVNATAKTAALISSPFPLPADIQNYYISFANDDYVTNYLITARNSDSTLTFLDPTAIAPNGVEKWLIRGQPKGEIVDILSYIVYYAPLTDQSYKTWRTEQDSDGTNA